MFSTILKAKSSSSNLLLSKRSTAIFTFQRFLSLKTLTTPNENALKFQADQQVLPASSDRSSYQITLLNQNQSPLAVTLFENCHAIQSILIGGDFITITKDEFAHWNQVRPLAESIITSHLKSKEEVINLDYMSQGTKEDTTPMTEEEKEITEEIEELIATKIRPSIQEDGGDIVFLRYSQGTVYVQLQGACTSCSLSDDTLKSGILSMLNHYIEEVTDVVNLAEVEFMKFEQKMKVKRGGK
ncbi:hypothetical protein WICPIJ_005424 [Wickerhamomyces pijperi]|uniref:Scaffold protein Nfu/NifU N-terminal domain-containing protein n=1 Tax=Wickerhamomyces pijperi TaxID=599730 RepID=A0A9P8Q5Q4_WICPI|nr:hypothetical protein WICPIJ_005424 [Wickerhamomyces pijperi]